ncbi:hypothetical protein EJB05_55015, partial [Eragrostis curvula]
MAWYKVADASQCLAITGWGIDDVKVAKKTWVLVGQRCTRFDISPVNYTFEVQAMSSEKQPFILPAVFTIGPKVSDVDKAPLLLYAKLMIAPHDKQSSHVRELVKGVIEGETRVLAASMTMEEIFHGTKSFKQEVLGNVQLKLNQFGLYTYNANFKQVVDVPGQEYLSTYLGQKTQQGAMPMNQAKGDVAEARITGQMDDLVEIKNARGLTEKFKAEQLTKATVQYETQVQESNAALYNRQKAAESLSPVDDYEAEIEASDEPEHDPNKEPDGRAGSRRKPPRWAWLLGPLLSCVAHFAAELVIDELTNG